MEMAFRTEATAGAGVDKRAGVRRRAAQAATTAALWLALGSAAFGQMGAQNEAPMGAQMGEYQVRHSHLHKWGAGTLRIEEMGISFEETGKGAKHSREWGFDDIQQLVLGPDTLRIVTYEDQKWKLGRDRVYEFEGVPAELAGTWYPILAAHLDQRFVATFADPNVKDGWTIPVKIAHGRSGSEGDLVVFGDGIRFLSETRGESRTWRWADIRNVATSGPFDLVISAYERDFRFQLRKPLDEQRFDALWRRINTNQALQILSQKKDDRK
jgi:hypothetical protein